MAIRTDVFAWDFTDLVTSGGGKCASAIKAENFVVAYKLAGQNEMVYPPKKPDPTKPEDSDPLKFFRKNKWSVSPMNPGKGDPASIQREAAFEKLTFEFDATVTCQCSDPDSCNQKIFHLTFVYDAASNKGPETKCLESVASKCGDNQKPTRKLRAVIAQAPLATPQESFEASVNFSSQIVCGCDPIPCDIALGIRYGFKVTVVAD